MTDDTKKHSWAVDATQLGASYEGYLTDQERSDLEWEIQENEPACCVLSEEELEKFLTRLKQAIDRRNETSLEDMLLKAIERSAA
jgi:hypothetical protein